MNRSGRMLGAVLLVGAALVLAPLLMRIGRSWTWRVEVAGHSMEPTLLAGDWLLVDPLAYRRLPPTRGDLVVAPDGRTARRWLVKRVDGILDDGRVGLTSDHAAHAGDHARLEPVEVRCLIGRPWLRYWPLRRLGSVS
jgi:signal peptidase I